jgi:hypothetical protein
MIRAQAVAGGDVVHLWAPDPIIATGHALCGAHGPAIEDQAGQVCATCWRVHGRLLGLAFTRVVIARP